MERVESLFEKVLPFANLNMAYESIYFASMKRIAWAKNSAAGGKIWTKVGWRHAMLFFLIHIRNRSVSGNRVYQRIMN